MVTKEKIVRNQKDNEARLNQKQKDVNKRKIRRMLDRTNRELGSRY